MSSRGKKKRSLGSVVFSGASLAAMWTPFVPAYLSTEQEEKILRLRDTLPESIWQNSQYEVWVYPPRDGTTMIQLSIKRRDKQVIRRWRDLQRIKNEIVGPEREAMEMYPAESRLVDTANQYHLWVLPEGVRWPFGYQDRLVMDGIGKKDGMGSCQEPFRQDERPTDLVRHPVSFDDAEAIMRERYGNKGSDPKDGSA